MRNMPDHVLNVLCRDILPTIRKTGRYHFEDHLDRLDAEFLAADDQSADGEAFARYAEQRNALLQAWKWIVARSGSAN